MLALGVVLVSSPKTASAQAPNRRYSPPSRPALSPYLNYFRQDTGAVGDSYNAFIVPQRQLRSQLDSLASKELSDFRSTQKKIEEMRAVTAGPTGVGGTFMNYSHYYQGNSSGGGGRKGR